MAKIVAVLGAVAVVVLFFFSQVFAMASGGNPSRLFISLMFSIVPFIVLLLLVVGAVFGKKKRDFNA